MRRLILFVLKLTLKFFPCHQLIWKKMYASSGNPCWNGKAQYSWPPSPDKLRSAAFDNANIVYFFTKQATIMRRSTVLSLPLQIVFPGIIKLCLPYLYQTLICEAQKQMASLLFVVKACTHCFICSQDCFLSKMRKLLKGDIGSCYSGAGKTTYTFSVTLC